MSTLKLEDLLATVPTHGSTKAIVRGQELMVNKMDPEWMTFQGLTPVQHKLVKIIDPLVNEVFAMGSSP